MHHVLTLLHTLVSAYPFGSELALTGIVAFGWILGRTSADYAETLKHPSTGGLLVAGLCGPIAVLLGLSLLLNSLWFHHYSRLPLIGGLLIGMLIVAAICQPLGQRAARQYLLAEGYERSEMLILPKQRGS
jgi:hypothetical protein